MIIVLVGTKLNDILGEIHKGFSTASETHIYRKITVLFELGVKSFSIKILN